MPEAETLPPRFVDAVTVAMGAYAVVLVGLGLRAYGHGYALEAYDAMFAAAGALVVAGAWRFAPRFLGRTSWKWNVAPALVAYGLVAGLSVALDLWFYDVAIWRSAGWPLHYADLAFCGATRCRPPL